MTSSPSEKNEFKEEKKGNPSFARQILYETLKLYAWSDEKIEQAFNDRLLSTHESDELISSVKFLKENNLDYNIFSNIYNAKKTVDIIKQQQKDGLNKPFIEHPKLGRSISEFAKEVVEEIKNSEKIFFKPDSKEIVEVREIKEQEGNNSYQGFSMVSPSRFITLIEEYTTPCIRLKGEEGHTLRKKSITAELAKTVLISEIFENGLPHIKRIFTVQMPIMYHGKLTFPKKGYDNRFQSWLPEDAPCISKPDMELEEAKKIIREIYEEFCFKDRQDFTNAVAGLLTPYIKGLYSAFNVRSPVFFYIANRERAGKDYLAGITGIVYEGSNIEEPPISTGEKSNNETDELRKKILAALRSGRKRLHFQNNKGYINNSVLESVATATCWVDRLLGRNEELTFENELDLSLSGNVGIGFTPDLNNRSRKINLFLDIEDANMRTFTKPNLHQWVKENRELILSALYSLIRNWIDKGAKVGSVPYASFPEWAKICGGIMEAAGYQSPCNIDIDTSGMAGDTETSDMKALFELCYETRPDKWLKKSEIVDIIQRSDVVLFPNIDFNERSGQTKFSLRLNKFIGRWLSNILLKVNDINMRSSRQELMFTKTGQKQEKLDIFGNLGNDGNVIRQSVKKNDFFIEGSYTLPKLPTLPNFDKIYQKCSKCLLNPDDGNYLTDDGVLCELCINALPVYKEELKPE